ncbi:S8 family serine peptidase [Flavobacterium rakeshii]|uniref:S8 family serine peptidase n=1 Tax=Flavobacterium rakeshii TaxID=1038845 RepID=UPI002E7AD0D9|nr:S8 family serine peptidase [Flavobacterium rakeshii]MEE1896894.1 S8 family serine peptidase [Flavobacterium rakeshii]
MKKILFTIFLASICHAQEKITLKTNHGDLTFKVAEKIVYVSKSDNNVKFNKINLIEETPDFVLLEGDYNDLKKRYVNVEPVLLYRDIKQICFDEVVVKLKDRRYLKKIFNGLNYTEEPDVYEKNQYLVKIENVDTYKVFDLINKFYNDPNLDFIEPNFLRIIKGDTNDPLYSSQWSIENNGYNNGVVGADMKVDDAWGFSSISNGTGVKVAVLDVGIDLNHPDLQANLLPGYDALHTTGGGYAGVYSSHGTACAGIIGAVANNNIGTVGVAYNCKILPVRIGEAYNSSGSFYANDNNIRDAINWSWQNGADVISNSNSLGTQSSIIDGAINNAIAYGRSGKGCVILSSAGNENNDYVGYPASNEKVIAVGASNQNDVRKSPQTANDDECWGVNCTGGSNYGNQLDVVAPGYSVYTTDITGNLGYEPGDYHAFTGTSAACPNAAGVVALIFSTNPNLTGAQARVILESTTDKVGGYVYNPNMSGHSNGTWNFNVGYGRINARKAVEAAYPYKIEGGNPICYQSSFSLKIIQPTPPSGSSIIWSSTPNIQILNNIPPTDSNQIVVKSNLTTNTHEVGIVYATINGVTISKEFDLGQKPYSVYAEKTSSSIMTEYCDLSYHYLPVDIVNSDPDGVYNYTLSGFNTGISSPNVTYTTLQSGRYLLKIPLNEIPVVVNPVITFTITTSGSCASPVQTTYLNSIAMRRCFTVKNDIPKNNSNSEVLDLEGLSIYPNPVSDVLNIVYDEKMTGNDYSLITATLYSMDGRKQNDVILKKGQGIIEVDTLAKGIYILKINGINAEKSYKIVVD